VGPRAGLDVLGKRKTVCPLMGIDARFFGRPFTSQCSDYTV